MISLHFLPKSLLTLTQPVLRRIRIPFIFVMLLCAFESSAQIKYPFPTDSAKWYFVHHTGNDTLITNTRFYRYSAKGDTMVLGKKYYKVYRQIVSDSSQFNDANDTLHFFVRYGQPDSALVYLRYADSVNVWDTSEVLIANFNYDQSFVNPDTFLLPFTINSKAEFKTAIHGEWTFKYVACEPEHNDFNYGFSYIYHIKCIIDSADNRNRNMSFIQLFGEETTSWFWIDFDSLALEYDYPQIKNPIKMYRMETYMLNPNSSTKEWFRYDADCLVSLKEESLQTTNFKIYPNPTHSHLTIKSSEQIFSLGIFNSTGQLVLEPHPSHLATDIDLNVSSLPKGIYFIRVNQAQAQMVILMD